MKIDVNQINIGDFVQINMEQVAASEIEHYVKEGEWYEVVDKDCSVTPLKIKFAEDFSYWVLECRILTYKKKESEMSEFEIGQKIKVDLDSVVNNSPSITNINRVFTKGKEYEIVRLQPNKNWPVAVENDQGCSWGLHKADIILIEKGERKMKEEWKVGDEFEFQSGNEEFMEDWKVGDEFEFQSGNEEFMEDWNYSMDKRYTVEKVYKYDIVAKNDKGESYYVDFCRIRKVNPVEELSRKEKIKQLRRGDEIYIIPEKIDARSGRSLGLSSEERYVVKSNDGFGVPILFGKRGTPHGFWAKPSEIVLLEEKEVDVKKSEAVKEEKEQIGWKVGDKFTIKSNYLGLLEGPATTETIFKVTDVVQNSCRVKFDSTKYGGWRDDGRHINDIIKVEDCCEPIEKQEKEEMEIKVGDFVKIKKEEFEYLCSCYKKGGGTCNVSQDGEYEVVKVGDRWSAADLIDFKDLDGDVVNGIYAHRFYKVSKKQEEKEEMKSVERTAFDFDCHEQIKEKLNYLNLSQVAKDDILGLVELYVEAAVEQKRVEFEQEIDQRYQEKLESLKKVLDI